MEILGSLIRNIVWLNCAGSQENESLITLKPLGGEVNYPVACSFLRVGHDDNDRVEWSDRVREQ
jgi:hypothetical protein